MGYFPSSYVARLLPGEKVVQVISGLEISGESSGVKLLKDQVRYIDNLFISILLIYYPSLIIQDDVFFTISQIVIKEGEEDSEGMVMIRTSDNVSVPCPIKYLGDI